MDHIGRDGEHAFPRHGVARVQRQVQHDPIRRSAASASTRAGSAANRSRSSDLVAHGAPERLERERDDAVQIDRLLRRRPEAPGDQEIARGRHGALGAAMQLARLHARRTRRDPPRETIRARHDQSQMVLQVVHLRRKRHMLSIRGQEGHHTKPAGGAVLI